MSAKKKALGRGLGALLQNVETTELNEVSQNITGSVAAGIAFIPMKQIEANPYQPRKEFDEAMLKDLSESIKAQGVIVPITGRKITTDKYQLIAGERRFRASKQAGLDEIPAYVRVATDTQMLEMALVENIQRENLNAIEVALSYQALISDCNLTQEKLSERVGKNRTTITNYLRLLKLPAEIQIALNTDQISMAHARAMISIENPENQLLILHKTIQNDLSVRAVENLVKNLGNFKSTTKTVSKSELPEKYTDFKTNFEKKVGIPIEIKRSRKGKGTITIPFSNDKDFELLVEEVLKLK